MIDMLVGAVLVISGLFLPACSRNKIYDNYTDYGNGYEAAQKGKSAPSFWSSDAEKTGYEAGLSDLREGNKPPPVDFKYTEEELRSLDGSWNTFEEMVNEALSGNREAMFVVGLCYLYGGKGLPIDISAANMFFAKAASLGHAPSLDKIRAVYIEESPNLFLHNVYVNLVIAMGHTEYTMQYHRARKEMLEQFGEEMGRPLVKEIERIAQEKIRVIYANLDELEKARKLREADGFFIKLDDITFMDHFYDSRHWQSVAGIE
jgi:TPR repeat protein